jgi:hypothetical protein
MAHKYKDINISLDKTLWRILESEAKVRKVSLNTHINDVMSLEFAMELKRPSDYYDAMSILQRMGGVVRINQVNQLLTKAGLSFQMVIK